jgi:hypothetical protein
VKETCSFVEITGFQGKLECLTSQAQTAPIRLNSGAVLPFKSEEELGITSDYAGTVKTYDGSGYQVEFDYTMSSSDYRAVLNDLIYKSRFFDKETLSFAIVNMDFYQPSVDIFLSV